jgi:hypothetical protein
MPAEFDKLHFVARFDYLAPLRRLTSLDKLKLVGHLYCRLYANPASRVSKNADLYQDISPAH